MHAVIKGTRSEIDTCNNVWWCWQSTLASIQKDPPKAVYAAAGWTKPDSENLLASYGS